MALGLKLDRHFNGEELSEGKNSEDRITLLHGVLVYSPWLWKESDILND